MALTVNEFIAALVAIRDAGGGDLPVMAINIFTEKTAAEPPGTDRDDNPTHVIIEGAAV